MAVKVQIKQLTLTLIAVFYCVSSWASEEMLTGVFSSLVFHEETGDVLGIEVFVLYTKAGYMAVFQDAEGEPSVPSLVPATVDAEKLSFYIPEDASTSYKGLFKGRICDGTLKGSFEGGQEIVLPRGQSYWQ